MAWTRSFIPIHKWIGDGRLEQIFQNASYIEVTVLAISRICPCYFRSK